MPSTTFQSEHGKLVSRFSNRIHLANSGRLATSAKQCCPDDTSESSYLVSQRSRSGEVYRRPEKPIKQLPAQQ